MTSRKVAPVEICASVAREINFTEIVTYDKFAIASVDLREAFLVDDLDLFVRGALKYLRRRAATIGGALDCLNAGLDTPTERLGYSRNQE